MDVCFSRSYQKVFSIPSVPPRGTNVQQQQEYSSCTLRLMSGRRKSLCSSGQGKKKTTWEVWNYERMNLMDLFIGSWFLDAAKEFTMLNAFMSIPGKILLCLKHRGWFWNFSCTILITIQFGQIKRSVCLRITKPQNHRGWKGSLEII